ncbi:SO_0444 family Cu/Zn efflux transporter [Desulfurivibrio sp. D14AmB]|uniref:SO_0444 family Cu/Zn efflux transporter n=1 Tax=Desulfurivibrio sp. D14AmB TaxID=3374370 RepID=UPI00376F096C
MLTTLGGNLLAIALDAAPWLLLGLLVAGLIKAWIPEGILQRWLGGGGVLPVLRAALIGAPLPLCSCGAIPLGLALYRGGASRGATTAFMVGTPGVGVDSVTLSYALLGLFMAIFRPLAAIFSAVAAGLLVNLVPAPARPVPSLEACGANCSCSAGGGEEVVGHSSFGARALAGLRYSFSEVLDDIAWWLLLGLLLAGLLLTIAPPGLLAQYAVGPAAMLVMALIGIPMYLCAQAATPVAAALIVAGVSPGTALVLLLAGPITSIATLSVLNREFGFAATTVYTLAVAGSAIASGLLADMIITRFAFDIPAQIGTTRELLPDLLKYPALVLLLLLACRPLRLRLLRW